MSQENLISDKLFFTFEDLQVYKKSLILISDVYKTVEVFPEFEKYSITSQFIRAANSIALNIAEGAGNSNPQFIRYLNISRGSIRECIEISFNAGYLVSDKRISLRKQLVELSKMISGLINSLK